jgi:opacity protein-like surface antigen
MKKLTVLAAGLLLLIPALSFADSISLRGAYFMPRALSNSYLSLHPDSLWTIELDQMSFAPKDYRGGMIGFSYDRFLGPNLSMSLTVDAYNKSQVGYYNDWVLNTLTEGDFAFPFELYLGDDIVHSFRVGITPVQLSLKLLPLGRKTKIIPYVGGGGSLVFTTIRMFGDQVNFADPWIYTDPDLGDIDIYPVEALSARETATSFGWHAFAGFQVPIGYRATVEAEARYHSAKARFNDLFVDFDDFEVGGLALTVGLSYWF